MRKASVVTTGSVLVVLMAALIWIPPAGFPNLGLSLSVAGLGFGFALLLAGAAGFFPALSAFRSRITDMLRTV